MLAQIIGAFAGVAAADTMFGEPIFAARDDGWCGESCPVVPGVQRDDWPFPDPKGQPLVRVREIRDAICKRVRELVTMEGWGQT